jgi:hypothetical protein
VQRLENEGREAAMTEPKDGALGAPEPDRPTHLEDLPAPDRPAEHDRRRGTVDSAGDDDLLTDGLLPEEEEAASEATPR